MGATRPLIPRLSLVDPATIGYRELAERIHQALGVTPSLATLRAAGSAQRRAHTTRPKPGITTGMPAPLPAPSRTSPARFDTEQIDTWLTQHPLRQHHEAITACQTMLKDDSAEDVVVAEARRRGLTWREITTLLNAHSGTHRTTAGIHKRYTQ